LCETGGLTLLSNSPSSPLKNQCKEAFQAKVKRGTRTPRRRLKVRPQGSFVKRFRLGQRSPQPPIMASRSCPEKKSLPILHLDLSKRLSHKRLQSATRLSRHHTTALALRMCPLRALFSIPPFGPLS
jgi:hypothetical protein